MRAAEITAKLLSLLGSGLEQSLGSMTGREFSISAESSGRTAELQNQMLWQQHLGISPEPVLWVAAPRELWFAAGQMTLSAVGVDDPSDDDCRSTWQEILGQAVGAFTTALTTDIQQEVTATPGEEVSDEPLDVEWNVLEVRCAETVWLIRVAWAKALPAVFERQERAVGPASLATRDSNFSKTFDLLLDVALPVAVSFGKTSLQIREVLKLNTGSIVELNRFVAEPVDVIVNECVIARGEVVVVDGNYGVRITQLASREDRMRMGMAESPSRAAGPVK